MKRILLLLVTIATLSLSSFAQAPEGFSYQAVIRNSANLTLDNTSVGMQLKIREGSITGPVVYTETFDTSTNSYGLVNLTIGGGTTTFGNFSAIAWATNGPFFIETAVDETGGTTYVVMGTSKLMSVAYAFHANTAGSVNNLDSIIVANALWVEDVNGNISNTNSGNVTAKVADEKDLTIGNAGGDAYFKVSASATAGSEDVRIVNTNGTDEAAISLTSTAGGIYIDAAVGKDVNISGGQVALVSKDDVNSAISLTTNVGTSETIEIKNIQGTSNDAIRLKSEDGGVSIHAMNEVRIDAMDKVRISGHGIGSDAITMETYSGGIDINAGIGGLDMDANGSISLDAISASNFTSILGSLTLNGASGINIIGNSSEIDLTTNGLIDINGGPVFIDATNLDIGSSSEISIAALNINIEGNTTILGDVSGTNAPTAIDHLTRKDYVDAGAAVNAAAILTLQVKPSEGAFADGDKTKLDGIEANADVTDASNVAAAGAVMTTGDQTIAGFKTFSNNAQIGDAGEELTIGNVGFSDWAGIRNASLLNMSSYALIQNNTGTTILNAALNETLHLRNDNVDKIVVAGNAISLNDNQLRFRSLIDEENAIEYNANVNGLMVNGYDAVFLTTSNPSHATAGQDLVVRGGRVGINTNTPSKGLLHVNGWYYDNNGNFAYYNSGGSPGYSSGQADVSIYATNRIHASEFNAFSDERIKNIIGISNTESDLNSIKNIEITDYTMKDKIKGSKIYKKVIAQQLEKVYPSAVSLTTDVVPDIYAVSAIKDGFISLKTNLKKGDKVKLIFDEGAEMATVTSTNAKGFKVNLEKTGNVFVYGREVDDFRTVDYEAISMLNVSATQELYKLILKQQKTIENQKTEISAQMEVTEKMQSDFDNRIKVLEEMFNMSTLNK